ncbi:hypothetical protein [Glutamicibacter arilaitensis]|uniref:hypothetical protein n=1 Tax=Glutamicibacter arilaitensis TaxID=256701 RepID=UPI003A93FC5C
MEERKSEENRARTAEPDQEVQPGDERVARRGEIKKNTEERSEDNEERYDAG